MATEKGVKLDTGKPMLGLVINGFAKALTEVGQVGTFGAIKYTKDGWQHVPNGKERYTDAMYRHLLQEAIEGPYDEESELLHAAHAAWNALARLHFIVEERDKALEEAIMIYSNP